MSYRGYSIVPEFSTGDNPEQIGWCVLSPSGEPLGVFSSMGDAEAFIDGELDAAREGQELEGPR